MELFRFRFDDAISANQGMQFLLPGLDYAEIVAKHVARRLVADDGRNGRLRLSRKLLIEDCDGKVLGMLPVAAAVKLDS